MFLRPSSVAQLFINRIKFELGSTLERLLIETKSYRSNTVPKFVAEPGEKNDQLGRTELIYSDTTPNFS